MTVSPTILVADPHGFTQADVLLAGIVQAG
jgi:hypothetical protein